MKMTQNEYIIETVRLNYLADMRFYMEIMTDPISKSGKYFNKDGYRVGDKYYKVDPIDLRNSCKDTWLNFDHG